MFHKNRLKRCEQAMAKAETYDDWREAAARHDRISGANDWVEDPHSNEYDYQLIQSRTELMRRLRRDQDVPGLVFCLREELHGNLGNMANPVLYTHSWLGTKRLIHDYLDEVVGALEDLRDVEHPDLPIEEKIEFFKRAAQSFGRSALMLSGGATLGLFHLGVVRELWEHRLLPRVFSGSSAGSIIASVMGTHNDEELNEIFELGNFDMVWSKLTGFSNMLRGEGVLDSRRLKRSIDRNVPRMTFEEAYAHTSRKMNISVSPADPNQFPRLLNYLTAPNVLVGHAALASAAIPGIFPPVTLYAKNRDGKSVPHMPHNKWIDGSVHNDIPTIHISRKHNVNHFIVSQANPHVVPFLSKDRERRGIVSFLRQLVVMGPIVQVEHILEAARSHFDVPGLGVLIRHAHALSSQPYRGDVTIYPNRQFEHWLKTLSNPTPELIDRLVLAGRRATWPELARVRNTTRISNCFDQCLRDLAERTKTVQTTRVPKLRSVPRQDTA
ncbi:MAG: DUF3336 domain-containing protein [Pseudomonadota bacterium]